MVLMEMVTRNIFIRKSIHWEKIVAKNRGGVGITSGEIVFLGKMPTRKIFTRSKKCSKNKHR